MKIPVATLGHCPGPLQRLLTDLCLLSSRPFAMTEANEKSTHLDDRDKERERPQVKRRKRNLSIYVLMLCLFSYGIHLFLGESIDHPIALIHSQNRKEWKDKIFKQSTNLQDAIKEYERRYDIRPPIGFDQWYQYAQAHEFVLIDEFDQIMQDLRPFWKLSGKEVQRRIELLGNGVSNVSIIQVSNGEISIRAPESDEDEEGVTNQGTALVEMIKAGGYLQHLPNMTITVNERPDGRVLAMDRKTFFHTYVPAHFIAHPNYPLEEDLYWYEDETTWDYYTPACGPAPRHIEGLSTPSELFSTELTDRILKKSSDHFIDFCHDRLEHELDGNFFTKYRPLRSLVPLFSPGKITGFKDILIPSALSWKESDYYRYSPLHDTTWNNKTDKIYWRGASSGGRYLPAHYDNYHRQRLVRMANSIRNQHTMMIASQHSWEPYMHEDEYDAAESEIEKIKKDFESDTRIDVAFSEAVDCDPVCDAIQSEYRFANHSLIETNWRHKYLIDLDGYGYSARFLPFLKSNSLVFKSTINKEWFSNWITPWVHYVPLSLRYTELAAVYKWLTGNEELDHYRYRRQGPKLAQTIAKDGSLMAFQHLRKDDMAVYVYRLMLEWARVQSDDRRAMAM